MRVALLLPALSLASLAVAAPAPASQDADLDKRTLGFIGDIIDGIFDFNFNWQNWQGSLGGKTCPAVYTYKYDTSKYTCETQTFVSLLPALTYSCTKQRTLCNAVAVTRSWLVWWGHTTSDCTNQYNQCINRANADCAPKSTSIKAPAPTISVSVPALVPTPSVSIQAPAPSPTVVYGGDQRPPADSNGYHSNGACSESLSGLALALPSHTLTSIPPPSFSRRDRQPPPQGLLLQVGRHDLRQVQHALVTLLLRSSIAPDADPSDLPSFFPCRLRQCRLLGRWCRVRPGYVRLLLPS